MRFDDYTPEVFIENFKKDSEVFGEETTQAIYEEIFSTIIGKNVKLESFVEELRDFDNLTESPLNPPVDMQQAIASAEQARQVALASEKAGGLSMKSLANIMNKEAMKNGMPKADIKFYNGLKNEIVAKSDKAAVEAFKASLEQSSATKAAINAAGSEKISFLSKIGKFLTSLPAKVKLFFGGLKGKSFGEIMKNGMAWLQANPMLALKTTGGIALLGLLIRALKKRGELNKYKALAAIEAKSRSLQEDCYETIFEEDTKEKEAMRKVLEECRTNKKLAKVILG